MNQAINTDFYSANNELYNEMKNLDNTIDFIENGEFVSKAGIKKDAQVDAIEIILDLVKMGKIDPWNIDIVDLYDKYIKRISELKMENLRSVGKAILFSSTLLKIKSDILQVFPLMILILNPRICLMTALWKRAIRNSFTFQRVTLYLLMKSCKEEHPSD